MNVVNRALKALFTIVYYHARAARAEMRMIISTVENIEYAVFFGNCPEKSTHKSIDLLKNCQILYVARLSRHTLII